MSNTLKDDNSLDINLPYSTLSHINKRKDPWPVFSTLFTGIENPIFFMNSEDGDGVKAFQ
jgi:hypothetical protein